MRVQLPYKADLLAALLGLLIAIVAWWQAPLPTCTIGSGVDVGCARGFQTRERDGQRTFRWSDDHAWIDLAGAGWGGPHVLQLTLAAPRSEGVSQPEALLTSHLFATTTSIPAQSRRYFLLLPPSFPGSDTITIDLSSSTFEPPRDERDLGVAAYQLRLLPLTTTRLPGVLPLIALMLSALAFRRIGQRLLPAAWQAWFSTLALLLVIGLAWIWLPERVAPFLLPLGLIAGAVAWAVERYGVLWLGWPIWLATLGGVLLDASLASDLLRGGWVPLVVAAQAALLVWAAFQPAAAADAKAADATKMLTLLLIALVVRLAGWVVRILLGNAAADADTELFYNYGRATIELGVPIAEYPSGALLIWALLAQPASRELFALLLPLLNLVADLGLVAGLWIIARRFSTIEHVIHPLVLAYAITPLLLPFFGKYDALPAALIVLGLASFSTRRYGWAGIALGLGGAIKWVPWLAAPILGWFVLLLTVRDRHNQPLIRAMAGLFGAIAAASLPFALQDLAGFLAPYTVQGARPLIGESFWFLPAVALEPQLLGELAAPWSGTESAWITPTLTLTIQLAALIALGLGVVLRPATPARTLALAALAPAAFLLLNRVFSPQYTLPISACLLAAALARPLTRQQQIGVVVGVAVMQAANLLVWPYTRSWWLVASLIMFLAGIGTSIWLAWAAYAANRAPTRPALQSKAR
ncbi:MAG: hypothetical protein Fur005_47970 [Roseiflexaceae bacterium]